MLHRLPAALALALAASPLVASCGGGAASPPGPVVRFSTSALPPATTGRPYEAWVAAEGDHPPLVFRVVGGRLPEGVSLDGDTGRLSGWPRSPGPHRVTIEALDGVDPRLPRDQTVAAARAAFDLPVERGPVTLLPDAVPPVPFRRPFRHRFEAAGGVPPYRFALAGGTPPAGLWLSADGQWAGIADSPASEGEVVVEVADAGGGVARAAFAVRVVVTPLAFPPGPLPDAAVGVPYAHHARLHPAGGGPPHRYALSGQLPPGLSLDEARGVVEGVPAEAGTYSFGLSADDAAGQTASTSTSIRVNPGPALHRLVPARYRRGSPEVRVEGCGFRTGMTVRFGDGPAVPAEVLSDGVATATPPEPGAASGPVDVGLRNADGAATVAPAAFRYPLSTVEFARVGAFGTARGKSRGLAAGDLDGDGRDDLVHAGASGIEALYARPGPGATGLTFELRVVRSDGAFDDVRVADVDADGDLDVVAARSSTGTQHVEAYANDGTGRLPSTPTHATPYAKPPSLHNPNTLAVGDVDGDGVPDAVLTSTRGNQGALWVFRGLGDGSFETLHHTLDAVHDGTTGLYAPTEVALADLDGDGRDDLLLADEIPGACAGAASCPSTPGPNAHPGVADGAVWAALSAADGLPGAWRVGRTGAGPALDGSNPGLCAADVDGDGRRDVAVFGGFRDQRGMGVAFLAGDGAGGFAPIHVEATAYARRYGARLDADLDACDDVVCVGGDGPSKAGLGGDRSVAEVWLGASSPAPLSRGWTSGPADLPGGSIPGANPGRVAVGDFDGDGLEDFAVLQSFHVKERFDNEQGDGEVPGVAVYRNRSR